MDRFEVELTLVNGSTFVSTQPLTTPANAAAVLWQWMKYGYTVDGVQQAPDTIASAKVTRVTPEGAVRKPAGRRRAG